MFKSVAQKFLSSVMILTALVGVSASAVNAAEVAEPTSYEPTGYEMDTAELSSNCSVNGKPVPCEELQEQLGNFAGLFIAIAVIGGVFGIWSIVFWIMMLIHVLKHEMENKVVWVLLMLFTGIFGSVVYYFMVKRPMDKKGMPQPPVAVQQ